MASIIDQSQLGGDWVDRSQQILEIGDSSIFERLDKGIARYSVSNPHPGFGKDPNILNEMGHTKYPMWVDSKITNTRVLVANAEEEAQHTQEVAPQANGSQQQSEQTTKTNDDAPPSGLPNGWSA